MHTISCGSRVTARLQGTPAAAAAAAPAVACHAQIDRRQLLLCIPLVALALTPPPASAKLNLPNKAVDDDTSPYIQELLRKTAEKKDERVKERLDAYYRKNFKDYFDFEAGTAGTARARGISPETQQKIGQWLQDNQ